MSSVLIYIHGGGFALRSEKASDPLLTDTANAGNMARIAVRYRLTPEHGSKHLFPAGDKNCYNNLDWLVANAESKYGACFTCFSGEARSF